MLETEEKIKKHSEMTEDEKQIDAINNMSLREMTRFWRFAPSNHPWLDFSKPYYQHFRKRFNELDAQCAKGDITTTKVLEE